FLGVLARGLSVLDLRRLSPVGQRETRPRERRGETDSEQSAGTEGNDSARPDRQHDPLRVIGAQTAGQVWTTDRGATCGLLPTKRTRSRDTRDAANEAGFYQSQTKTGNEKEYRRRAGGRLLREGRDRTAGPRLAKHFSH